MFKNVPNIKIRSTNKVVIDVQNMTIFPVYAKNPLLVDIQPPVYPNGWSNYKSYNIKDVENLIVCSESSSDFK